MGSKKTPSVPIYFPPPQYQAPAPYVAPPDPQVVVPPVLTPGQIMTGGADVESKLPTWLQFTNQNPLDPAGRSAYEQNFYDQYIRPQVEQTKADIYSNGQSYGSYGGALVGQTQAQGQLSKYQAGLDYANQLYNNMLQGRQSYFNGGPNVVATQNNQDVQRGLGIAGIQAQNAGNQNQYNLNASNALNQYNLNSNQGLNNFNQQNYSNQLAAYQARQQAQAQRWGAVFGGLNLLGGGASRLMGGGGGGMAPQTTGSAPAFTMPSMSYGPIFNSTAGIRSFS